MFMSHALEVFFPILHRTHRTNCRAILVSQAWPL